jgi:hypothetical protein
MVVVGNVLGEEPNAAARDGTPSDLCDLDSFSPCHLTALEAWCIDVSTRATVHAPRSNGNDERSLPYI